MEFDIEAGLDKIDFGALGLTEIMQNVNTIISTIKGTVPLDRGFGVNGSMIDMPIPLAKYKFTSEIAEAIEKYEPRCKVVRVSFEDDSEDGILIPKVRVRVDEQYI